MVPRCTAWCGEHRVRSGIEKSCGDGTKFGPIIMTDFFMSKLPSGHAVKDITKAAAVASLRGDTVVQTRLANTVPLLLQQCAAVVWLRSDVCTADNLEKLALAGRAYLLRFCLSYAVSLA